MGAVSIFESTIDQLIFAVLLRNNGGEYQVLAPAVDDSATWRNTGWYTIPHGWSALEIDYQALAYDGSLSLWVDGIVKETLSRMDNDTRTVGRSHLGPVVADNSRGALYFDDPSINSGQATNRAVSPISGGAQHYAVW